MEGEMKTSSNIARTILRLAQVWGGLILLFIAYFVISYILDEKDPLLNGLKDPKELFAFLCFPVITSIGLLIAYKWPLAGGIIALLAMFIGMIFFRMEPEFKFLVLIYSPALLYLIYWKLSSKDRKIQKRMKLH